MISMYLLPILNKIELCTFLTINSAISNEIEQCNVVGKIKTTTARELWFEPWFFGMLMGEVI